MMKPLVSIALPVFNSEKTLPVAIRSILNQTYSNWELIVLNDGSTDDSVPVIRSFKDSRIRLFSDKGRKGISARLNQAISLSRGKYFARMDSDDVSFPKRIELQVEFLESNSLIDLLGTNALVFTGNGVLSGVFPVKQTHEEICARPWWGFLLPHPSWMGRAEWFMRHKYRSFADKAEDQDLLFRTYKCSRFACLPQVLLGYRENKRNIKKMLFHRYAFFRAVFQGAVREKKFQIAIKLAILQPAKFLGDIFNIGLGFKQLRNPILPAQQELLGYWNNLWTTLR